MSVVQQPQTLSRRNESAVLDEVPSPPIELEQIRRVSPRDPRSSSRPQRQVNSESGRAQIVQIRSRSITRSQQAINADIGPSVISQPNLSPQDPLTTQGYESRAAETGTSDSNAQRENTVYSQSVIGTLHAPARIVKNTVEVKGNSNILTRLLTRETISLRRLTVTEVDEFDEEEAETKYQKFTDFLRATSNDLARPENDPLKYFRGRWIEYDQVLLQSPEPGSQPLPYIRFIGARNEEEVKILHASLSKRTFRMEYFPPLRLCYVLKEVTPLASGDDKVVPLQSSPNTLCGTLVAIGSGESRRIVTIGGMVESLGSCYALTTNHLSREDKSSRHDPFSDFEINEDDYDDDIDSPLIIDVNGSGPGANDTFSADDDDENGALEYQARTSSLGTIKHTGSDWALVKLDDPQFALPNLVSESAKVEISETPELPMRQAYLGYVATEPKAGFVRILAGASGPKTMLLLKKSSNLRIPSGAWVRAWKAKSGPTSDSRLRRGDSGAWVVDPDSGTVYGHVMAATEEYAYILPLADILKDIQLNTGIHLRLASPFGQLAELANVHYLRQNQALAHYYAKSSLSAAALSRSAEMPLNAAILKHIKENPRVDSDLMEQIVMRTGHHIVLGLPRIWDDAREGKLGKPDLVLAFLRDLSNVAGITVPHGSNTGKQKQGVGGMTEMVDSVGGDSSSGHSDLQREAQTDDLYLLEEASADPPAYSKEAQAGYSDLRHESESSKVNTLDHAPGVGLFRKAYDWMLKAFWVIEMDVTMIGLQNSGKTRLLRIFAGEEFGIDSIPTVGLNCKRIQRGHVTIKFWDLGGQPRFRSMWERYCRGVNVVVFVVNTADMDAMPVAREELHALMSKPSIERVPLLVLGNNLSSDTRGVGKSVDMRSDALTMDGLVDAMGLRDLRVREVSCYLVDARNKTSLDAVLHWLIARAST